MRRRHLISANTPIDNRRLTLSVSLDPPRLIIPLFLSTRDSPREELVESVSGSTTVTVRTSCASRRMRCCAALRLSGPNVIWAGFNGRPPSSDWASASTTQEEASASKAPCGASASTSAQHRTLAYPHVCCEHTLAYAHVC
jgi:hypothetical protein